MIGLLRFHCPLRGMLCVFMMMSAVPQLRADQSASTSIDCSTVNVDFTENPEWTRQERIEAMNKAFYKSLQRYQLCQLSKQSSSAKAGGQASGSGDHSGATAGLNSINSVASPVLTGTKTDSNPETDSTNTSSASANPTSKDLSEQKPVVANQSVIANGKTPEDIPGADNDDVIAAQIRLAAEIEKDPDKKASLWNEYRKYKGLPTR